MQFETSHSITISPELGRLDGQPMARKRFPIETTKKVKPKPYVKSKILICTIVVGEDNNNLTSLACKGE
jgi:hypothetical protein